MHSARVRCIEGRRGHRGQWSLRMSSRQKKKKKKKKQQQQEEKKRTKTKRTKT